MFQLAEAMSKQQEDILVPYRKKKEWVLHYETAR